MPETVQAYSGELPFRDSPENVADKHLHLHKNAPKPQESVLTGGSPYREMFRQGATLVPRMLCLVERQHASGFLGSDRSMPFVVSRRTAQEKAPWKSLPGIEGRVEAEFIRPVLLGESILPYRVFRPFEGVIPVTEAGVVLDAQAAATRGYSGLPSWMQAAERVWSQNSDSAGMTLVGRWNYHNELGSQFPLPSFRVIYAASGTIPAAAMVHNGGAVIEHKLYWASVRSES
jgi:hypothetical protein